MLSNRLFGPEQDVLLRRGQGVRPGGGGGERGDAGVGAEDPGCGLR